MIEAIKNKIQKGIEHFIKDHIVSTPEEHIHRMLDKKITELTKAGYIVMEDNRVMRPDGTLQVDITVVDPRPIEFVTITITKSEDA